MLAVGTITRDAGIGARKYLTGATTIEHAMKSDPVVATLAGHAIAVGVEFERLAGFGHRTYRHGDRRIAADLARRIVDAERQSWGAAQHRTPRRAFGGAPIGHRASALVRVGASCVLHVQCPDACALDHAVEPPFGVEVERMDCTSRCNSSTVDHGRRGRSIISFFRNIGIVIGNATNL